MAETKPWECTCMWCGKKIGASGGDAPYTTNDAKHDMMEHARTCAHSPVGVLAEKLDACTNTLRRIGWDDKMSKKYMAIAARSAYTTARSAETGGETKCGE